LPRNIRRPRRQVKQARYLAESIKIELDRRKRRWCTAEIAVHQISEFPVDEIVDQVLHSYEQTAGLDAERLAKSREKISHYIDTLASAGQNDPRRLAVFARAYLKQLHEGPDPRFTGC
jgi:hypothetical protein